MSRYKPYRVCPYCGSHLDWGERCDCGERRGYEMQQEAAGEAAQNAAQPVTAQEARKNFAEPVLLPGA